MSRINKICKLTFEKNNKFGLINAKKVRIHKETQTIESTKTDFNFLKLFNI